MSQNRNSISKQVLAWTAVFALVLSILPYSVADQNSNEWFSSWSSALSDMDGDNQNDTITFTFDVDTNVTDYVDVEVSMEVRDANDNYVGGDGEEYEIYWTNNDTFEMEWFVDDCEDYDEDCEGPYDFYFRLYEVVDGYWYFEDNFTESDVYLYETTIIPEGLVQVDNAVFADDDDGVNNDIMFSAFMEDYLASNVSIELERKVGTQWVDAGDQVTDDEGEVGFSNMTAGEYRWFAEYDGEAIDEGHTFVFYSATTDNLGHVGIIDDWDDDDDFDDFIFARWSNGSDESINDGVYVEIFYEDNNTLYDEDGGDGDDFVLVFQDVEEGNYTFNLYNENSSGDLMQTGWLHSYGSLNTNHDEWFEDWDYETNDEDNNGIDDVIVVEYNPDTTCNCTVDIMVEMEVFDEEGNYVHSDDYEYEINGTAEVWFETDEWSPYNEGNYTFEFYLYGGGWEPEDSFNFSAYLECNDNNTSCDHDEWFEDWDYETEDNDNDGGDDTITIGYDPDTECDCYMDVRVYMDIVNADTGNYVDSYYYYHEINGTDEDWFETGDWSPDEDGNYTFNFTLYDENWNWEDEFSFTTYLKCNTEGNYTSCDYDEWFEDWDYETNDTNNNGVDDVIIVGYNPDTECDCYMDVRVYMDIVNADTGNYVDSYYYYHEINGTEEDWFETDDWSPDEDGNYTFIFRLYDENWNYEDNFDFTEFLECAEDCDANEWFEDWDYETVDTGSDNLDDTIEVSYNPDTDCDCEVEIYVEMVILYNSSGYYVDEIYENHIINGTEEDWFTLDWTSHNSTSYDFEVYLRDEDWDYEDSFRIENVFLYEANGAGGPGDDDEYFDYAYYITYDEDEDGYDDTFEMEYDPDTTCECWINVTFELEIVDNTTGQSIHNYDDEYAIYHDDNDYRYLEWTPDYNGSFDFYIYLHDEDGNLEDRDQFLDVELNIRSEDQGGESDEWFYDLSYNVDPSSTINIQYDPDTDCSCNVTIIVEIEIFDNSTGDSIDFISEEYDIYSQNGDNLAQSWSAYEDGNYDFYVYLYDEDWNFEDSREIYNVYLEDDGYGHNFSDDGVGFVGYIAEMSGDGFINDFLGAVYGSEAYYEIYSDGNIIDSGFSDESQEYWFSENLAEGWYDFAIAQDEEFRYMFQEGLFYSYGNSSGENSDIMNVAQAIGENEDVEGEWNLGCDNGPCDDALFIAFIGPEDNTISDVKVEIKYYYEEDDVWDEYATEYTNESGLATVHDLDCGEYTWDASYNGDHVGSGYFVVLANCDSDDEENAWFHEINYVLEDLDGDGFDDSLKMEYVISSDCECDMNMLLMIVTYNESWSGVDYFEEYIFLPEEDEVVSVWFSWTNFGEMGNYTFDSILLTCHDCGNTSEESIEQDNNWDSFYFNTFDDGPDWYIEDVTGRDNAFEGQILQLEAIIVNAPADLQVRWYMGDNNSYQNLFSVVHTYADNGIYEIVVDAYDSDSSSYAVFEIEVRNRAPTILNVMYDEVVNEGDEVSFNIQYEDVSMDDISVQWVFPDAVLEGSFVKYTFADDGEFLVSVEVKDKDGGSTTEQRMVTVQNVAPVFTEFVLPSQGEQGVSMVFSVAATDPGDDTITYTFDFGDGTAQLITQTGNATHKFASGDTFEVIICAIDEDGGETCRTEVIPVDVLEQLEDSGLPGFGFLGVISALGAITLLRRRTH